MTSNQEQSLPVKNAEISVEKVKEILLSNGITDPVSEVTVNDAGRKGDGFVSLTKNVTVTFEDKQQEGTDGVKRLNLFAKLRTQSTSHAELLNEMKAFEKEAVFLAKYVPAAQQMCREKGREGFIDFYPQCYYADEKMTVVENLVLDKGYEMLTKGRQDFEAAQFAMKTLAKHHAVSHVIMKETGSAEQFFEKFPHLDHESYSNNNTFIVNMMEPLFNNSILSDVKILEVVDTQRSKLSGAEHAVSFLKSFFGKPVGILIATISDKDDDSLYLLCHGDYWNNNMMFLKNKETGRIMHHVAIDFQVTRYNSLATDIGYYLFSSVQPSVRQNCLKELLELYRETFNEVTKDFGHPVNLSYERLLLEYRKKLAFGFWIGFLMAVGPAMAIFRDVDVNQVDVADWVVVCGKLVDEWIEENSDKAMEVAEELVKLIREYEELVLN